MLTLPFLICTLFAGDTAAINQGEAAAQPAAADASQDMFRAVWTHSGAGAFPGDWQRSMDILAKHRFNAVFANMLWANSADYASDVLPRSEAFRKYGDQIEKCCAAAKPHGIEVHVWKVHFYLLHPKKEYLEELRRAGRLQMTAAGKEHPWLCPSHPENQKLELDSMLEIARKYPVAGLHSDYIRYPQGDCCYCDGCRERFEVASGKPVADWPKDCYSGSRKKEYTDWRCRQITALVERIGMEAKKIRPEIKYSTAVFGGYPSCRESVAQDWPEWVKAGLVDFVCPMDYTEDNAKFEQMVRNQVKLVEGRVPVYAGIGALASMSTLTAERVAEQVDIARRLGAKGFVIFSFNTKSAETIIPHLDKEAAEKSAAAPLASNADFNQGDQSPTGWTLSGGKGRWVDREVLEVTGVGDDHNQWQCPVRYEPGRLYRFQVRARSSDGSRAGYTGPDFANRDHGLCDAWRWYGHVFRAPDHAGDNILRLGQWQSGGTVQFDAVRLSPVVPVHKKVGELPLGDGESIEGGKYHFRGEFDHEGSNFHRPLISATAGFNSNRWCLSGVAQATYRFALPKNSFKSGKAGFVVNYHERGSCVAEVSRDGKQWRSLVTKDGLGMAEADLPADLFPAEAIYLRLRPATPIASFQVNGVGFSAELASPATEGEGQTVFAETTAGDSKIAVEEIAFDDANGRQQPEIVIAVKNNGAEAARAKIQWRELKPEHPDDADISERKQKHLPTPPVSAATETLAPGQQVMLTVKLPLAKPGTHRFRLAVLADYKEAYSAVVPLTLPEYYRADYGHRLADGGGPAELWWCEADWKVAPQRPAPTTMSSAVELSAARNDREAAQIVVRPKQDLKQLTIEVGPLYGEGPSTAPWPTPDGPSIERNGQVIQAENVKVMRVYYHRVHTPTDETGSRDLWPDALPPLDKPIDLPAGQNQPLWMLVSVPADAAPGDYAGVVKLKAEGWSAEVPIKLHVWSFTLPKRNHVETAFGLPTHNIFRYHRLKSEADQRRVWDTYMQIFAEHRLSPYHPAPLDPIKVKFLPEANPPRAELDFTAFDAAMSRAIEQFNITNFQLNIEGLGGGTYESRTNPNIAGFGEDTPQYQAMFASYVKQIEEHLRAKGWLEMAFIYWFDEPEPKDYKFVRDGMERLKKYAPGLCTMLTEQPEEALAGPIDLWCPVSFFYNHAAAEKRRAAGERFWWYVCCGPHAPYCTLFIDHPATDLRVWFWQTWQRKIVGNLVWESNYWTSRGDFFQNPYEDPMSYVAGSLPEDKKHWGNGDGRFVYPPLSVFDKEAGDAPNFDRPVSSIRLEMLREGIEDYEYLWLLRDLIAKRRAEFSAEQIKQYEELLAVPDEISRDATTYTKSPGPIHARRAAIAAAIEQLSR